MYGCSLAWVLLGTALLVGAILTRGNVMRYGLYRVFSLFGLGASLMLLAYLYQAFESTDRKGGGHSAG